jgi:hypothetical protein
MRLGNDGALDKTKEGPAALIDLVGIVAVVAVDGEDGMGMDGLAAGAESFGLVGALTRIGAVTEGFEGAFVAAGARVTDEVVFVVVIVGARLLVGAVTGERAVTGDGVRPAPTIAPYLFLASVLLDFSTTFDPLFPPGSTSAVPSSF